LVVAADGVGSKSWLAVSGEDTKARSSGFSVYRVVYPTKLALQNPTIAERFPVGDAKGDIIRVWLAKNSHAIVLVAAENTTWFLTHKVSRLFPRKKVELILMPSQDGGTATETWAKNLDASDVIASLDKTIPWDPVILEVIKLTPPKSVVDYKILWRNPNTKWASDGGHIIQLGDSAHSFLPTSANGATQAMEDGISLAACLRMGGRHNIALATRVQTRLR
jgi:2-polyprenyl-6-methoxyphenol hydroxylase-like FAD-dependent oxidoreductase